MGRAHGAGEGEGATSDCGAGQTGKGRGMAWGAREERRRHTEVKGHAAVGTRARSAWIPLGSRTGQLREKGWKGMMGGL